MNGDEALPVDNRTLGRAIPIEEVVNLKPFRVRRRIAFRDCDPAGIVYTPRFLDPIATSAIDLFMMDLIGPAHDRDEAFIELGAPAKALDLVFHRPARNGDLILLDVRCNSIGRRTFTIGVEGSDEAGSALFSASMTLICVTKGSLNTIPVPHLLKELLAEHSSNQTD